MLRYVLARPGQAVLVLFVVATVVFLLSRASGNAADLFLPQDAPPETLAEIKKNLGLDKSIPAQYVAYLQNLATGDLGQSFAYRRDVNGLIRNALPNTIELGICAFAFGAILGIGLGALSAIKQGSWLDSVGKGLALVGQSVPSFFLGMLLVIAFSVRFRWFPPLGKVGSSVSSCRPSLSARFRWPR